LNDVNLKEAHDITGLHNESNESIDSLWAFFKDESDNESHKKKQNYVDKTPNASKSSIQRLKNRLVSHKTQLNELKEDLQNSSSLKAYETLSEARRKAQLKTEETIADQKMLHGFDINDDESELPPEMQLEIETIQKKNDALIEQTESYEKTLISESESCETKAKVNKILNELDKKIERVEYWTERAESGSLKEKEKLEAREELKMFNLKSIKEKISLLPFNAKKVKFVENKQDVSRNGNDKKIGLIKIEETMSSEKLNIFKFKEVERNNQTFTLPSRQFHLLDNGTYVVGGYVTSTQKSHLIIYDPIKKRKTREAIFDNRIDELFTFKNQLAFSLRKTEHGNSYMIKIMDENLNLIRELANTTANLKGVNDSQLYCISISSHISLVIYDWNLNEIKSNVVFQFQNPKQSFFLKADFYLQFRVNQLVKRDNRFILNFKTGEQKMPNQLFIFNEVGVLLKQIDIEYEFVIDSRNNIVANNPKKDLIFYYDLNGDLFKTVSLKRPKNENKILKQMRIDLADKIYFAQ